LYSQITMTDILAQRDSNGIIYEPYEHQFRQCIYEEPDVQGRNERYEFRCDANLFCCGRVCCVTEEAYIPWWLWLLPLLLLLLLCCLLPLLWYLFCRKKRGDKLDDRERITKRSVTRRRRPDYDAGYRSIDQKQHHYSDLMPNGHGHGNGNKGYDEAAKLEEAVGDTGLNTSGLYRQPTSSYREEETFEEEFKEEIEIERTNNRSRPASIDSL